MATFQPKNSKLGHWLSWIWKGNNGHFWGLTECPQCWHLEKARFDIKLKLGTTQISIGKVSWFFNHYIWYANSDNSFFQDMLKICWEKSVLRTLLAASHRAGRTRFSPWRSSSWTFWSATILGNTWRCFPQVLNNSLPSLRDAWHLWRRGLIHDGKVKDCWEFQLLSNFKLFCTESICCNKCHFCKIDCFYKIDLIVELFPIVDKNDKMFLCLL